MYSLIFICASFGNFSSRRLLVACLAMGWEGAQGRGVEMWLKLVYFLLVQFSCSSAAAELEAPGIWGG